MQSNVPSNSAKKNCIGPDLEDLSQAIEDFALRKKTIDFNEIQSYVKNRQQFNRFVSCLEKDERFIKLGSITNINSLLFLPKKFILKRVFKLNLRIATLNINTLSVSQFFNWPKNGFPREITTADRDKDRDKILSFLENYCLVSRVSENLISFPMAKIFMHFYENRLNLYRLKVSPSYCLMFLIKKVNEIEKKEELERLAWEKLNNFIISNTNCPREYLIVTLRYGLSDGKTRTLEEVGKTLGLTRERVRQIEKRFLRRCLKSWENFLAAGECLILELIAANGRMTFPNAECEKTLRIKFLCNLIKIPNSKSKKLGCLILGATDKTIKSLESLITEPNCHDKRYTLMKIQEIEGLYLSKEDYFSLSDTIARNATKKLHFKELIYFALKKIGRPAHYIEITQKINEMYPSANSTPKNILAVLSRGSSNKNNRKNLWVWIGVKGVYALKEWGYERPKINLHEAVFKIVKEHYEKTGKPATFLLIQSEISKFRSLVNRSSLTLACHLNPKIAAVDKNRFIPKEALKKNDSHNEAKKLEDLDRQLREIEKEGIFSDDFIKHV